MTTTSDPIALSLSLIAGLIAGGLFFAGLRYTIEQLTVAKHPGAVVFFSFIVRVAIVLLVLFLVGRDHIERMLVCLLGFLIARFVVMLFTRNRSAGEPDSGKEATGASQS